MHLRQSGMPFNVIALRLGHESTNTTHLYVDANPEIKEKALARLDVPDVALKRFRARGELMKFLQALRLYKVKRRDHQHVRPPIGELTVQSAEISDALRRATQ